MRAARALVFALLTLTSFGAWSDPLDPVAVVRVTAERLFELVNENRALYEQDQGPLEDALREILLPRFDVVYSGRLVLGRTGRDLQRQQIEDFAHALSNLLIQRYADGLLAFKSRDQVEILPLSGENTERMTRVRTRVRLDSGDRAPVDYVFRKSGEHWQIFDVIFEGISYVATFRNQIGEEIRRDGFDAVLARLQSGELEIEFDD